MKRRLLIAAVLLSMPCVSQAALTKYNFVGVFTESSLIFQAGDIISGSYTFEAATPPYPHPDITLKFQSPAISTTLPGTGWEIDIISASLSGPFSVTGGFGIISIGNDTAFGDRYIATLTHAGALPLSLSLSFFQIDMQDPAGSGADMLSSDSIGALPDLSLAANGGGRFIITDPGSGCSQCFFRLTSLTESTNNALPEPGILALLSLGLFGLYSARRRHPQQLTAMEI